MAKATPPTFHRDVLAGAGFFAGIAVAPSALAASAADAPRGGRRPERCMRPSQNLRARRRIHKPSQPGDPAIRSPR